MDFLIVYGIVTFVTMAISAFGVMENSKSYERDERKVAARSFVLAPLWPVVLLVWACYGLYFVVTIAFGDKRPESLQLTRRLWLDMGQ